eukprot:3384279-Amphidinium_carterae.2
MSAWNAGGTTPALQKDPQGGRPRLFLKPRTVDSIRKESYKDEGVYNLQQCNGESSVNSVNAHSLQEFKGESSICSIFIYGDIASHSYGAERQLCELHALDVRSMFSSGDGIGQVHLMALVKCN